MRDIILYDLHGFRNNTVAENVRGVGLPPLKDLMAKVFAAKVPIFI
jgi:hypothetical protein